MLRPCSAPAALSIKDVDSELSSYSVGRVHFYKKIAAQMREADQFSRELQEFTTRANSMEKGVEAFFRGFLGDSMGTYKELKEEERGFVRRREQSLERFRELQEQGAKLDHELLQLRIRLQSRYHGDFPAP